IVIVESTRMRRSVLRMLLNTTDGGQLRRSRPGLGDSHPPFDAETAEGQRTRRSPDARRLETARRAALRRSKTGARLAAPNPPDVRLLSDLRDLCASVSNRRWLSPQSSAVAVAGTI